MDGHGSPAERRLLRNDWLHLSTERCPAMQSIGDVARRRSRSAPSCSAVGRGTLRLRRTSGGSSIIVPTSSSSSPGVTRCSIRAKRCEEDCFGWHTIGLGQLCRSEHQTRRPEAAIHVERVPLDVSALVGAQEHRRIGDLLGRAVPGHGDQVIVGGRVA